MDQFSVTALADQLEADTDKLLAKEMVLNADAINEAVDYLDVLQNPAASYPELNQEAYSDSESDHKLSLLGDNTPLMNIDDRIMVNHVDGSISGDKVHFTYNHETPLVDGQYSAKKDLEIIKFGLEVIGAVLGTGAHDQVKALLSPDAVVSLTIAAHRLRAWQLAE
ncbi:hypothetical protein [Lacticaseibacillus thailandensis]|uniref:Uncharacterized protein n=1 Tax=Lacticaseibacillus thailandensis DSM 22698 = JCM 13996 TaxID=1423810 RepID=A0A0R2CHW6_9LACO|nr:hypothetical protein [Lacticaseibacillus thailandensis]KRM87606.1 hypothetical protein FD19_GL001119 [Lacticaseibacillus thailandensis DSM 22698 = JCM 13996]